MRSLEEGSKHTKMLVSLSLEFERKVEEYEMLQDQMSPLKRSTSMSALERLSPSRRSHSAGFQSSMRYAGAEMMKGKITSLRPPKPLQRPPPKCTHSQYQFGMLLAEDPNITVKFSAGQSGMKVNGAQVVSSSMQAWMLGVRPGWTITAIAGTQITQENEDNVLLLLEKAKALKQEYDIVFQKGRAKFGTGVAQLSKIEQEREDNLNRLRRIFKFQGNIERSEQRAITYTQLERVFQYAAEYCPNWKDQASPEVSMFSGKALKLDFFNFAHANSWIVLPATERRKCSFVELLTAHKQVPKWCIIHWWGGPMSDFMKCVKLHMTTRGLPPDTPYWISMFAQRQHVNSVDEICTDKRDTSFFKALNLAQGQALLTLGMAAKAFRRVWCSYEASMCLGTLLDIAVCQHGTPQLLTNGLTAPEERMPVAQGIEAKATREAEFPLQVVAMGMEIEIEKSECTSADERGRILNAIAGRPLESEPVEEHPAYDEINKRLRGHFAAHLLVRACLHPELESESTKALWSQIAVAIQGDVWRKNVNWKLDGMGTPGMELLLRCLPPGMEDLTLRMRGSSILDDDLVVLAEQLAKHPKMGEKDLKGVKRTINLDLKDSDEVGDGVGDDVWKAAFDALSELGVTVNLDYTEIELAGGEDPLTKAMGRALQANLVGEGVKVKDYVRRVLPAVPTLCKILQEDDRAQARKAAAKALGGLGQAAFDAVPVLQRAQVDDEDEGVKRAAAFALGLVTGAGVE